MYPARGRMAAGKGNGTMIARMLVAAVTTALACAPAAAGELVFTAYLSSAMAPTQKDSQATGVARMVVDTERRVVALNLEVAGVTLDQLDDRLSAAPIGPIHLHAYGHAHPGDPTQTTLALPLPYGPGYTATPGGFRVTVKDLDYARAATLGKSDVSFEAFVASLRKGDILINVHTDRAGDGEIAGAMTPVS